MGGQRGLPGLPAATQVAAGRPAPGVTGPCPVPPQYIDAIGSKQSELEGYVSEGYKTALTEERRRFCFLVEKQCAVAKNSAAYHSKVGRARGARGAGVPVGAGPRRSQCPRQRAVGGGGPGQSLAASEGSPLGASASGAQCRGPLGAAGRPPRGMGSLDGRAASVGPGPPTHRRGLSHPRACPRGLTTWGTRVFLLGESLACPGLPRGCRHRGTARAEPARGPVGAGRAHWQLGGKWMRPPLALGSPSAAWASAAGAAAVGTCALWWQPGSGAGQGESSQARKVLVLRAPLSLG